MEAINFMHERNLDRANAWKKSVTEYYGVGVEDCVARQRPDPVFIPAAPGDSQHPRVFTQ